MPQKRSLPESFQRADLEAAGFAGWRTWDELRADDFAAVPRAPAAYIVYRPSANEPVFLSANPGGHFKGKDPTVAVVRLAPSGPWVPMLSISARQTSLIGG